MLGLRSRAAQEPGAGSDPDSPTESAVATQTPDGPQSRTRQVITIVFTLAMTVLWAWLVTIVLDASNFPSVVDALRHKTFDAPALLPSMMVVWVFVVLVLALVGRL